MKPTPSTEVKGLLSQLRDAAGAIKAQIHDADKQIAALTEQRRALTSAPVSKADFMEYVRADIQRRTVRYQYMVKLWAKKNPELLTFPQLEHTHTLEGVQMFPYLDGEIGHNENEFSPSGIYFHFGDLIAERFAAALEGVAWSSDSVSVAERRRQIAAIDAQIAKLETLRDGLASDLISSGMYE
jgi:hypothetical protein